MVELVLCVHGSTPDSTQTRSIRCTQWALEASYCSDLVLPHLIHQQGKGRLLPVCLPRSYSQPVNGPLVDKFPGLMMRPDEARESLGSLPDTPVGGKRDLVEDGARRPFVDGGRWCLIRWGTVKVHPSRYPPTQTQLYLAGSVRMTNKALRGDISGQGPPQLDRIQFHRQL